MKRKLTYVSPQIAEIKITAENAILVASPIIFDPEFYIEDMDIEGAIYSGPMF